MIRSRQRCCGTRGATGQALSATFARKVLLGRPLKRFAPFSRHLQDPETPADGSTMFDPEKSGQGAALSSQYRQHVRDVPGAPAAAVAMVHEALGTSPAGSNVFNPKENTEANVDGSEEDESVIAPETGRLRGRERSSVNGGGYGTEEFDAWVNDPSLQGVSLDKDGAQDLPQPDMR